MDEQCTPDHVTSVKQQGLCIDSALARPSIEYCSTDLQLESAASSGVNSLLVDSVLCVAVDNNEVVGDYVATPAEQSMAVASAFLQNPKSYGFSTSDAVDRSSASTGTSYEPGETIPVFSATATGSIPGPRLMGWGPTPGSSRCARRIPVRFGFDWPVTSCVIDGLNLKDVCESPGGVLDPSAIADNLLVAVNPSITSAASKSKSAVGVRVESLREWNPATGQAVELETPFPAYYPQPRLVAGAENTSTCMGALLGVAYAIYHNGSGLVERVDAAVTIGNLSSSSLNNSVAAAQSFSVRFVSMATITRSLERGNIQSYERSGNPGYLMHRPIRVGVLETSTDDSLKRTPVVSEMIGGLSLPGLGDCFTSSFSLPVLFGEDSQWSCSLVFNASSFKSFCESDSPVVAEALRVLFTHVARFGNADPFLTDEWLAMDYDPPSKSTSSFIDASGTGTVELACKNVLSSLRLEFLVAAVGPVNNPQNKIVAARAFHGKEDVWTFWRNSRDPAKEERYLLTTTVSFVAVQTTTLDQWVPPTPPLWFSIPNDVFYPFLLNDGTRTADAPSAWTTILWIGSGVLWTFVTEC
jgi:tectonic-1/3